MGTATTGGGTGRRRGGVAAPWGAGRPRALAAALEANWRARQKVALVYAVRGALVPVVGYLTVSRDGGAAAVAAAVGATTGRLLRWEGLVAVVAVRGFVRRLDYVAAGVDAAAVTAATRPGGATGG